MAKANGNELKNFGKANLNVEIDANCILSYRIETRDIIKVSAIFRKFNIENKDEISKYWRELKEDGILESISNNYKECLLGVCIGTQRDLKYKYGNGLFLSVKDNLRKK